MRQLRYAIKEEDKNNSIDMGLFVNGIPLITIELKNQLTDKILRTLKISIDMIGILMNHCLNLSVLHISA